MSIHHDPVLQSLFTEADEKLDDAEFTPKVIRRTYGLVIRLGLLAVGIALLGLAGLLVMGLSPLAVAQGLSETFTTPVFEVGSGWAGWLLTPINNIAGVLILGFKGYRILYKKVLRESRFS